MKVVTKGRAMVEDFMAKGVDAWLMDGRIDEAEAGRLRESLHDPEVERALMHAGGHFALTVPLRFPLGSLARFLYTLILRVRAEAAWLVGGSKPVEARRLHTMLVMLIALIPELGQLGYFFSPAMAHERALLVIPIDQASSKLPMHIYDRFHLKPFFLFWARNDNERNRWSLPKLWHSAKERVVELKPHARWIVPLVCLEGAVFLVGASIYVRSDRQSIWWFDERGVIATMDVIQLFAAAALGLAAYRLFWSQPRDVSLRESAGILLWGAGGVGLLVFAIDDYFTIHETLGNTVYSWVGFVAPTTNSSDDLIVLGYAIVGVMTLFLFRMELFARQASSTLLLMAAGAAVVMVLCDAFAHALALKALELPAQTLADSLLMFAFGTRYLEIRRASRVTVPTIMMKAHQP